MSRYVRHNFVIGQIFKAEHANAMEDGIIANEQQIELLESQVDASKEAIESLRGNILTVTEQNEGHVIVTVAAQ